jgi:hypothetical protein
VGQFRCRVVHVDAAYERVQERVLLGDRPFPEGLVEILDVTPLNLAGTVGLAPVTRRASSTPSRGNSDIIRLVRSDNGRPCVGLASRETTTITGKRPVILFMTGPWTIMSEKKRRNGG